MEYPEVVPLAKAESIGPLSLTVGQLRKFLAEHPEVPDNTPVAYQRVEDSYFAKEGGWRVALLPWRSWEYSPAEDDKEIEELSKSDIPGTYKIITGSDGKQYVSERDQYVEAVGCYLAKDDEGQEALCIHAHY